MLGVGFLTGLVTSQKTFMYLEDDTILFLHD